MHESPEQNSRYREYQESGGIINEPEYQRALERAGSAAVAPEEAQVKQAEHIAEFAGIELNNTEDAVDPRAALYGILRSDTMPDTTPDGVKVKYHHSQMSDQRLFAEALRILGDEAALKKLIAAYHKTGTHCPICSKVAVAGEECR